MGIIKRRGHGPVDVNRREIAGTGGIDMTRGMKRIVGHYQYRKQGPAIGYLLSCGFSLITAAVDRRSVRFVKIRLSIYIYHIMPTSFQSLSLLEPLFERQWTANAVVFSSDAKEAIK